jgi:beta-glucosidase
MYRVDRRVSLVAAAVALAFAGRANAQDFRDTTLPIDVRVADLISHLTLTEKINLLPTDQAAISRLNIAARRIGNEGLHGVAEQKATVFPQAIGFAHTWDPELIRRVGSAVGDEARVYARRSWPSQGLNYFSPVVDLARDPRWGRTEESYGEDPYISGAIGAAYVQGLQGDDPRYYKIFPTLKHFAANSMENNRTSGSSNVDPRNLREYYLKPFETITRQTNVQSYMAAYNSINYLPCGVSNLFGDVARAEWGFHGFVVTDAWLPSLLIWDHHFVSTGAEAAAAMIKAGIDSLLDPQAVQYVQDALTQGLLKEADIDRALRNNLRVRFRSGEFDPPGQVPFNSIPDSALMSAEHSALARQTGREAVVLLKNSAKLLPLDAGKLKRVAVIGPLANVVLRDWYSGYMAYQIRPLAGIQARLGSSAGVVYDEGAPKIALRSRAAGKWVTAGPLGLSALTAASNSITNNETFIAEDWGWGCTTLRSAVSDQYVSATNAGQFMPSSPDAFAWQYSFCFNMVPQTGGGVQLRYYDGSVVGAGSNGMLWYGLGGTFDVQQVAGGPQSAANAAKGADVAIVVVGNNTTINGKEGYDRPDIILPPAQDQLIQAVFAANPNTVVALVSSYPMSMVWEDAHVPAILYTAHGGQELGNSLADVLFGDYNPAGRLAMTWYKSATDIPPMADYDTAKGGLTSISKERRCTRSAMA